MASETDGTKQRLGVGDSLEFHYQKTSQYRVHHADGCVGGPTPRGQFSLSFFSERPPIPKIGKRSVIANDGKQATMGPEEPVEVLSGIVRQVEATVMMDLRTTQELYQLLGEQLAIMEAAFGLGTEDRVTSDSLAKDS